MFDTEGRLGNQGCAIVGINPGRAKHEEEKFYLDSGCTYDGIVDWFLSHRLKQHPYYKRLRNLADQIDLFGPILWTELAKCETKEGVDGVPLPTLRTCAGRFLTRELDVVPESWPLIAVGREAFKALAYLYPKRVVIGVPHPTGSWGHFARLFAGGQVLPHVRSLVQQKLESIPAEILWLAGI